TTNSNVVPEDDKDITIDQCINETVANSRSTQQRSIVENTRSSENTNENSAKMSIELAELKEKNAKLQTDLDVKQGEVMSLLESEGEQTAKHEQQLMELMQRIEEMQRQQKANQEKEAKLQQMANTIQTIEYNNIQKEIIHE